MINPEPELTTKQNETILWVIMKINNMFNQIQIYKLFLIPPN